MPLRAQFACFLTCLFAVLVGVTAYRQSSTGAVRTLAWLDLPGARDYYDDDLRRQKELDRFDGVVYARVQERYAIIGELCAGRMTLFEAAAQFKRLNAQPNPSTFKILSLFPGATDDERVCRQVLAWLAGNIEQLPSCQRQSVLDRLEAELREHIACVGPVELPGG